MLRSNPDRPASPMPARSTRPLFAIVIVLSLLGLLALLLTAFTIHRSTPEQRAAVFHVPANP
jgi:hypothetical protein